MAAGQLAFALITPFRFLVKFVYWFYVKPNKQEHCRYKVRYIVGQKFAPTWHKSGHAKLHVSRTSISEAEKVNRIELQRRLPECVPQEANKSD